jgi:hypothetical protein
MGRLCQNGNETFDVGVAETNDDEEIDSLCLTFSTPKSSVQTYEYLFTLSFEGTTSQLKTYTVVVVGIQSPAKKGRNCPLSCVKINSTPLAEDFLWQFKNAERLAVFLTGSNFQLTA